MLIAKCEECGYVEQVPDSWAGKELECSCGNTVHVPSKFKVKSSPKSRSLMPARTANRISSLAEIDKSESYSKSTYSRSDFIWRLLVSIGLCIVSLIAVPYNAHMLLVVPLVAIWQVWIAWNRIQDFNGHPANIVPIVMSAVLCYQPFSVLFAAAFSLELLGLLNAVFGIWGLVVFIRCLCEPTKTNYASREEA